MYKHPTPLHKLRELESLHANLSLVLLLPDGLETLGTTETTGTTGGNKTYLLTGGSVTADSRGMTNMLVITSTVGMLDGVHSHTTNLRPAVTLNLVLVVRSASLQQRLLGTTTTSDLANHSTAGGGNDLLGTGRELDTGDTGINVVCDDDAEATGGTGKSATVSNFLLDVADKSTLGHDFERKHVADGKVCLLTAVQELTGVHAFGSDEEGLLLPVPQRVAEAHLGKRSTTAGVVNNFGDNSLHVTIALGKVLLAQLSGAHTEVGLGSEDASSTFTLSTNNATHLC